MKEAAAQFELTLREIAAGSAAAEIRDNYRLLRLLWEEYRVAATQAANPESARKLAERAEEVVWIADKGTRMLHERARSTAGELVLAAAGASVAVQRVAKIHLHRGWALAAQAMARELKAAEAVTSLSLARLKSVPETDEDIAAALRVAEDQLMLMRQSIGRNHLEHMAKAADHIDESMERVGAFYSATSAPGS
jgi:hypothetical protein